MPDVVFSSKGADKLVADQEKVNKSVAGGMQNYRLTGQEAQRFERIATQITQKVETAQERYNRKLEEGRKALAGHKNETELLARYQKQLKDEFDKSTKSIDSATEAVDEFGKGSNKNFGDTAITQVKGWVTGFASVTAIIGTATKALQELAAERERFAADSKSAIQGEGALAQLATSEKQFHQLLNESRELSGVMGVSREEAADILFSIVSAGVEDPKQRRFFAEMRGQGLVGNVGGFAKSAATMRASMGVDEVGTFRQIVSKALAASASSPATAEALLEASSRGGSSAGFLGISDEELLAATSRVATATGSAERGGTQVASLLKAFEVPGNWQKGKSLEENILAIEADLKKTGAPLQGVDGFNSIEAVNAFRVLAADFKAFNKIVADVRTGQESDLAGTRLKFFASDPSLSAAGNRKKSESRQGVTPQALEMGSFENVFQSLMTDRTTARQKLSGLDYAGETLGDWMLRTESFLRGPEAGIERLEELRQPIDAENRETLERLRNQERNTERGAKASEETVKAIMQLNNTIANSAGFLGIPL